MNKFYGITIIAVMVLLPMLSSGSHAEEPYVVFNNPKTKPGSGIGIKAVNERLIVKNLANIPPIWCGSSGFFYVSRSEGVTYFYDVKSGKKEPVDIKGGYPMACSPDGKWFVYLDKTDFEYDTEAEVAIIDAWRYELATGKHERFAIMGDLAPVFSPSGGSLFMGKQPGVGIEMPEPKWKLYWSEVEAYNNVWLNESIVIRNAVYAGPYRYHLVVDIREPIRKVFYIKLPDDIKDSTVRFADGFNRFYVSSFNADQYLRCSLSIEEESIECDTVLKDIDGVPPLHYESLFNEDILIFMRIGEKCVRAKRFGSDHADCFIATEHESGNYAVTSPDDKYLAYTTFRENESARWEQDLYLVELLTD